MEGDILVSTDQMVRGFALWDARFRTDPHAFRLDVERLLACETTLEYGKACTEYFRGLLVEVK